MNIFEALRIDHDRQRFLLTNLIQTPSNSTKRDHTFRKLKHELAIHTGGEENHFYMPLINSDITQEKPRHGIAEHLEIDTLIKNLEDIEYASSDWLQIAKQLQKKVEHHLNEEEHTIFKIAGKVLSENQKTALAKNYKAYVKENRQSFKN